MRFAPLAVAALFSAPALAASFSGIIEMRLSSNGNGPSGNIKVTTAEPGSLTEIAVTTPRGLMKMKLLTKTAKPTVMWLINDAERTITELSAAPATESPAGGADDEAWTAKRLGTETVAGYSTVHVQAVGARSGTELELWTSRAVMSGERYRAAFGSESRLTNNMLAALKKEDADGFPVKLVSRQRDGQRVTLELVKASAGSPASSLFDIPAGYTSTTVPAIPAMPPGAAKMLEQQMKQMTPEQQEMMRKMMQGR